MNRLPGLFRAAALCVLASVTGCNQPAAKPPPARYPTFSLRKVPDFMKGTLYEATDLQNDIPFEVSSWGLVVNLDGTGGSERISNSLRSFMDKELETKGFGSTLNARFKNIGPEVVLHDPNAAVVGVYGMIPPGARKGQWFDVAVSAAGLEVTSLARGILYDTQLTIDGANPTHPEGSVNVWATANGPVFVNPALVLKYHANPDAETKRSLRNGIIIGGGQVAADRPLLLYLRQPGNRTARNIEARVNDYFHQERVCTAYDLGYCQLWVPAKFNGDWEHFAKVVQHLYMQGASEAFARAKARELVTEARKPGAPLQDISYCWEGLGSYALAELSPLLGDPGVPSDVRFAAARAAAYIGDPSGAADRALYDLAQDSSNSFQLAAVQVLGRIPNSRAVNQLLRDLLDSDKTTIRVEAYSILARNHDPAVDTRIIASAQDSNNQKFALDFVHSHGAPLIYATRSGIPRIAIFGDVPQLALPLTFAAMEDRLMIASQAVGRDVTIFYRDAELPQPVQMSSPPDLADVIARLAGQIDDGTNHLDFTYAEVLAILQGLSDGHKLRVTSPTGQELAAAFMLQASPAVRDAIDTAPSLERGRPQGDAAPPIERPAGRGPVGMVTDTPAVPAR